MTRPGGWSSPARRIGRAAAVAGLLLPATAVATQLAGQVPAAASTPGVVTNTNDSGAGSLREAIAGGAPAVEFAPGVTGTITLTSGTLSVRRSVSISGPGAGKLTVSGNRRLRVFEVSSGATVTIAGLTVSDGLNRGADHSGGTGDPGIGGGILNNAGATLTLDHVTVANSRAQGGDAPGEFAYSGRGGDARGGGIENLGSLTLVGTTVKADVAKAGYGGDSFFKFGHGGVAFGGGISNGGTLTLRGSTVDGNRAVGGNVGDGDANDGHGGGVYNSKTLTVENSVVHGNQADGGDTGSGPGGDGYGGGVESDNGSGASSGQMTMSYTTVSGNTAESGYEGSHFTGGNGTGGGLLIKGSSQESRQILNSTVSGNQALGGNGYGGSGGQGPGDGRGGGIFNADALHVQNSTVNGNAAQGGKAGGGKGDGSGVGGGFYNDVQLTLLFDTVSSNRGSSIGMNFFTGPNAFITQFDDTIVQGGGNANCQGKRSSSEGYNMEDANSCGFNEVGDRPNTDAKLGPLQDNGGPTKTQALPPGSPAIDQGDSTGGPTIDQRGLPRPVVFPDIPKPPGGNGADLGAFERQTSEVAKIVLQPTGLAFGDELVGGISPVAQITVSNAGRQDLVISSVKVTGEARQEFVVPADGCTGQRLATGKNCAVGVRFAPTVVGARKAALTIESNASTNPDSAPLSGTGTKVLSVTTTSLPAAAVGVPYAATLAATGGTTPYTWSIASGSLPKGLSLDPSSAVISGTPEAQGTSGFTVKVDDSSTTPQSATQPLSITVNAGAPPIVSAVSPRAGFVTGGTTITISGADLTSGPGETTAKVGSNPATGVSCPTSTTCTATTPAGIAGVVDVTVSTPSGTSATSPADRFAYVSPTGRYYPLTPYRILDTRTGLGAPPGPIGPGSHIDLQVTGTGGGSDSVPAGATAIVLNVTEAGATQASYLTVWPTGETRPTASNLNFGRGQVVPNLVEVGLSPSGAVSIYNDSGMTHVVADVEGYVAPATSASSTSGQFTALSPARVLDTRTSIGGHEGPLGPGQTLRLTVEGAGGVPPAGAGAVVLNVTATDTTDPSFLTVWPTGAARPLASNLNFGRGQTVPNRVIVPLGSDGRISIYNESGSANVVADAGGWFTDGTDALAVGDHFTPADAPTRILDTRTGLGHAGAIGPNSSINLAVVGGPSPAPADADAVVANTTVTDTTSSSYLSVYPGDQSDVPTISDLNWAPGSTIANLVVTKVGDQSWNIYNRSGSTDVIADVEGWYSR